MKATAVLSIGVVAAIAACAPQAKVTGGDASVAANTINALGVDLLSAAAEPGRNALLSPYSIQVALAMTYAGADGATRDEMARVLHYPADEGALHGALAELRSSLDAIARASAERAEREKSGDPITLTVANRLFGQRDYQFRRTFMQFLEDNYGAPLQPADFAAKFEDERLAINAWAQQETRDRIKDLIPPGGLSKETRLVLANAIYLKARWASPFDTLATEPRPFYTGAGETVNVPTMTHTESYGYEKREGYAVVVLPYSEGDLQFLILLPDAPDDLPELESNLTPELLTGAAHVTRTRLLLHMPRFRMEPPVMNFRDALVSLGMKSPFDIPEGSANFEKMAPRRPDDYLAISAIFHKTFIALDESGTEAAAATAIAMVRVTSAQRPIDPIEVSVDRPFLFAVQHRTSGACLFLGRVVDPRSRS